MAFPEYLYDKTKNWDGINLQDPTTARMYPLETIQNPETMQYITYITNDCFKFEYVNQDQSTLI